MKYNIIGYDLMEESLQELITFGDMYNYSFKHVTCQADLFTCIENLHNNEIFICIDIDTNKTEKFEMTTLLKRYSNVTVIYISDTLDADERLRWLNFGALTYIKKPFKVQELVIRTIELTNYKGSNKLIDQNFVVDLYKNTIEFNGKPLKVTPSIYNLIVYFIENEGRVVTREQIMKNVLNTKEFLTNRNVDTLIKELRKKTAPDVVKTVRGVGYQYNLKIDSIVKK